MSLSQIAARLKYADKDWKQFLDQKYDGGKKKVKNPHHATSKRYPEVTVNHAMKDEHFRKHIQEEYAQWKGSETEVEKTVFNHKVLFSSNERVDQALEKYEEHFSQMMEDVTTGLVEEATSIISNITDRLTHEMRRAKKGLEMNNPIPYYQVKGAVSNEMINTFNKGVNQWLIPYACFFGKLYSTIEPNESTEVFSYLAAEWRGSSTSPSSMRVHRYLTSLNVSGSYADGDDRELSGGEIKPKEREALHKAYTYQQAVFKHLGIKEVTLYRGVEDDQLNTEPPNKGDKVHVKTRPASSWTSNPLVGTEFGNRIVKCQVPVEQILMSPMTYDQFGGSPSEFEYVVMGAEGMECEIHTGVF
jgi:hypothetical protein